MTAMGSRLAAREKKSARHVDPAPARSTLGWKQVR
jgi:hypothetical protein